MNSHTHIGQFNKKKPMTKEKNDVHIEKKN